MEEVNGAKRIQTWFTLDEANSYDRISLRQISEVTDSGFTVLSNMLMIMLFEIPKGFRCCFSGLVSSWKQKI